jgi:general secretion pathway protein G
MSKIKEIRLIPRLVLAFVAGLIIFGIGINVTWTSSQGHAEMLQMMTRDRMRSVNSDIQAYLKKKGKLPDSLDIVSDSPKDTIFKHFQNADISDRWGRLFIYRITKTGYTLMSYGRDGKPGGVGVDSDITLDNANSEVPFLQAMDDDWTSQMIGGSAIAGTLTFFLAFFLIRPADFNRKKWGCMLAKLVPLLVVLFFLTLLIIALDVPSGH